MRSGLVVQWSSGLVRTGSAVSGRDGSSVAGLWDSRAGKSSGWASGPDVNPAPENHLPSPERENRYRPRSWGEKVAGWPEFV